ncbi:ANTAR domain-containing protein [Amycolatopsis sp. NPDC005232]|uniref:ANTAR domain-containing protein n=1 Tax=Amycolatopsis sp. NPDC005232 TaxID=3157027 RepID=UPI0033B3F08E
MGLTSGDEDADLDAKVAQLEEALASQPVVGQAKGMLMLLLSSSAEEAFDALRKASRHINVKLPDVATRPRGCRLPSRADAVAPRSDGIRDLGHGPRPPTARAARGSQDTGQGPVRTSGDHQAALFVSATVSPTEGSAGRSLAGDLLVPPTSARARSQNSDLRRLDGLHYFDHLHRQAVDETMLDRLRESSAPGDRCGDPRRRPAALTATSARAGRGRVFGAGERRSHAHPTKTKCCWSAVISHSGPHAQAADPRL